MSWDLKPLNGKRSDGAPLSQRIVERMAGRASRRTGPDRRGFLRGSALVGAAVATAPVAYVLKPQSAYAAVCGPDASCAAGYTVFCCTINGGSNSCPPNSFVGGWWKADHSSMCGGAARYYIDCNAFRTNSPWKCRCNNDPGTCDHRRVACNQFRYGQCSTQIPQSNSGPVVCRMVSCTPPWQQFSGVCGTTSFTDNRTAEHTATCLLGHPPFGTLSPPTVEGIQVRLRGWAIDPDLPSTSLRISVSDDTGLLGVFTTDQLLQGVNDHYHITGKHGFSVLVTPRAGRRTVTVTALDGGPGKQNTVIGRGTVTVPSDVAPAGFVDVIEANADQVRIAGWAFDRDLPTTPVKLHVYVDKKLTAGLVADRPRPDVNQRFGIAGNHGFDDTITLPTGVHHVDVYALNPGPGRTYTTLVANRVLDVNIGAPPRGALESVALDGERAVLRGWAWDPDRPSQELQIVVMQEKTVLGLFTADRPRADINSTFRITGNHGYEVNVGALSPGSHTFAVYGINVGGGGANPIVGYRTVRIGEPGAWGHLDEVSQAGTTLRLRGWVLDSLQTSVAVPVALSVDGGALQRFPSGLPSPAVDAHYGITGDHGFDLSVTLVAGRHTVSLYGVGLRGDALLLQQDVVIGAAA